MATNKYRAGAIGLTGRGNYGHNLHLAYQEIDEVDFVAVADPDAEGRKKAVAQTNAKYDYADYRAMLEEQSLNFVSICPRWVDQHEEMLMACIEAGCHVFCEKPMTSDLASADRIVAAAKSHGVKIAVAHQGVYLPQVQAVKKMVSEGRIGKLVALEASGKQDHRGGGEDMLVLGTHLFNMMRFFAGDPISILGYVGQDGQDVNLSDAREANEPIGLIAGDFITTTCLFVHGVSGHFISRKDQPGKGRGYGLVLVGEKGRIAINGDAGFVSVLDSEVWTPWSGDMVWQDLDVPKGTLQADGNRLAVCDLIRSVENDKDPISSAGDARWALEMIHGIYASHLAGGMRMMLPLSVRTHPLDSEMQMVV